jgi:hypothetical protein
MRTEHLFQASLSYSLANGSSVRQSTAYVLKKLCEEQAFADEVFIAMTARDIEIAERELLESEECPDYHPSCLDLVESRTRTNWRTSFSIMVLPTRIRALLAQEETWL